MGHSHGDPGGARRAGCEVDPWHRVVGVLHRQHPDAGGHGEKRNGRSGRQDVGDPVPGRERRVAGERGGEDAALAVPHERHRVVWVERPTLPAAASATATPAAATVASPVMARTFVVTSKGLGPGLADHCCVPGPRRPTPPRRPRASSRAHVHARRPGSSPAATRPAAPVTRPPAELPGRSATPTVGLTGATTGTAPSPSVSHPPRAARSAAARTPSTTAATDRSTPRTPVPPSSTFTASASSEGLAPCPLRADEADDRRLHPQAPPSEGSGRTHDRPELPRPQKSSTPRGHAGDRGSEPRSLLPDLVGQLPGSGHRRRGGRRTGPRPASTALLQAAMSAATCPPDERPPPSPGRGHGDPSRAGRPVKRARPPRPATTRGHSARAPPRGRRAERRLHAAHARGRAGDPPRPLTSPLQPATQRRWLQPIARAGAATAGLRPCGPCRRSPTDVDRPGIR